MPANANGALSAHEGRIVEWLAGQQEAMITLLRDVVDTDSGSYDKAGVDAVGEKFIAFFAARGLLTTVEAHERFGNAIHIRLDDAPSNEKPVLLMGHRDTVFPKGEAVRRPFRIEGGKAYGPGVADMKAGLVMNAFVLAAFKAFGGAPAPVTGLITSDEEIASPSSRPIIERVARGARCVLNAEPGRPSGNVVTRRKGGVFLHLEVTGRAAHSGGAFEKGISAIGEIAHKIIAMHALTGMRRGITVNVGLVKGGQSVNTTAPSAEGQIDLRYVEPDDRAPALAGGRHQRAVGDRRRVPAAHPWRGGGRPVCHLSDGRRSCRAQGRGRVLGRLRGLRLHRSRRLSDAVLHRSGRRQRAHRGGIPGDRFARASRPGARSHDPAPASRPGLTLMLALSDPGRRGCARRDHRARRSP
jgi:hypothetical protein